MTRANNSALMRIKNEKSILSLINRAPISRVEIAKKTGLTKAAVTIIVDDLKRRNIILEESIQLNTVGRNPVMLYLNNDAFYFIGINITRFNISIGITNLSGDVISKEKFPICPPKYAFEKIKESALNQISNSKIDKEKIYKVSVVTPGPVDTDEGKILNPPNFNEWHNVEVVSELKKIMDFDVVFENVSSATAIAEKYFGAANDSESFMILRVDEGVGSGVMIKDALFKRMCEFGHTSIKYDGIKCECGNRGCLEKYAAIPQILKETKYKTWQEAIDNNDENLIRKEVRYLSTAIISANNVFAFDKIVLCGDLTYKPQKLLELLKGEINTNVLLKDSLEICTSHITSQEIIASAVAIHDLLT